MDPNSDRYRICPNDGVEFMAQHRSMIHCCSTCADEFNNQKKKLGIENQLKSEINIALNAPVPVPQIVNQPIQTQVVIQPAVNPAIAVLARNIQLIGATLGNRGTIKVAKNYLPNIGVVLAVYEYKYQIPNTESNILTYGPYAIAWGDDNHLIVTNKKNITWIQ